MQSCIPGLLHLASGLYSTELETRSSIITDNVDLEFQEWVVVGPRKQTAFMKQRNTLYLCQQAMLCCSKMLQEHASSVGKVQNRAGAVGTTNDIMLFTRGSRKAYGISHPSVLENILQQIIKQFYCKKLKDNKAVRSSQYLSCQIKSCQTDLTCFSDRLTVPWMREAS